MSHVAKSINPLHTQSDEVLFERFADHGDKTLFEELLRRHLDGFYRFALLLCRTPALAEEATQDAVLALATQARRFRVRQNSSEENKHAFRNWGFSIVRNCTRHAQRGETSRKARDVKAGQEQAEFLQRLSPEQELDRNALCDALNGALSGLDEKIRLAVAMHYLDGLTCDAIGEISGVSAQMIHKRIKKGLELLRARLVQSGHTLSATALIGVLQDAELIVAPAGMQQRLASQIHASAKQSQRAVVANSGAKYVNVFAGILVVVISVGAIVWHFANKSARDIEAASMQKAVDGTGSESTESTAIDVAVGIDQEATAELPRRWTFAEGKPLDLKVDSGSWRWKSGQGDKKSTMVVEDRVWIRIPLKGQLPGVFALTIRGYGYELGRKVEFGIYRTRGRNVPRQVAYKRRKQSPLRVRRAFETELHALGNFDVGYMNGEVNYIAKSQKADDMDTIYLGLINVRVEAIDIRLLTKAERVRTTREVDLRLSEMYFKPVMRKGFEIGMERAPLMKFGD